MIKALFFTAMWAAIAMRTSDSAAIDNANDAVCVYEDERERALIGGDLQIRRGGIRTLICEGMPPVNSFLVNWRNLTIADTVITQQSQRKCSIFNVTKNSCIQSVLMFHGDSELDGEILVIRVNRVSSPPQLYASLTVIIENSECLDNLDEAVAPTTHETNDDTELTCRGYLSHDRQVSLKELPTFPVEKSVIVKCFAGEDVTVRFKINGNALNDQVTNTSLIIVDGQYQYLFLFPHNDLNGSTLQVEGYNVSDSFRQIYLATTVIVSVNCTERPELTTDYSTNRVNFTETPGPTTHSTNGGKISPQTSLYILILIYLFYSFTCI